MGSGLLPSCLLIFVPACRARFREEDVPERSFAHVDSYPAMIMRAIQKKSDVRTRDEVRGG